ncbi:hypothetical protein ACEWY4_009957 [Coilia grayii]|uniref:Uncharacterized protein n=1 Tax=Coilia grayii TaxID=363190 RepID=A0ABD1K8L1_9TELE
MGMDDPGPSKPLKGILRKGTCHQHESIMHKADCPLGASSSTGLPPPNLQSNSGTGVSSAQARQLKGILKTNLRGSVCDSKEKKCLKRQRWDEGNILATSCHSWLKTGDRDCKIGPHLCSITMLDDTYGEEMCLCKSKRKKCQSWDEVSILKTQHPSRREVSSTQSCYWDTESGTRQSFPAGRDGTELFPEPQPMSAQPGPWPQTEANPETSQPQDQVQVMDTSPASAENTSKSEALKEDDGESTSFEEQRKAYIRRSREILSSNTYAVGCPDEEENDRESEDDLLSADLDLTYTPASADDDGGECSGMTNQKH